MAGICEYLIEKLMLGYTKVNGWYQTLLNREYDVIV